MSVLCGHLDEVVVGDFTVPGDDERLNKSALHCRMSLDISPKLLYARDSQSDSEPMFGRAGSASAVHVLSFGDRFGTMTRLTVVVEIELMLE